MSEFVAGELTLVSKGRKTCLQSGLYSSIALFDVFKGEATNAVPQPVSIKSQINHLFL